MTRKILDLLEHGDPPIFSIPQLGKRYQDVSLAEHICINCSAVCEIRAMVSVSVCERVFQIDVILYGGWVSAKTSLSARCLRKKLSHCLRV